MADRRRQSESTDSHGCHQEHGADRDRVTIEGYHAKDGGQKAVGRNFVLPDGSRLFLGGSAPGGTPEEKK